MNVQFVKGAVEARQFPPEDRPFVVIGGRSNCGKSSLLNAIFRTKSLARVSKTPGRTTELNFFDVAGRWFIVDLPGYGFAAQPNARAASWGPVIDALLADPRTRMVLILADVRRSPQVEEAQLAELADHHRRAWRLVLTKADKVGRNELRKLWSAWRRAAAVTEPFVTSSRTGEGIDDLRKALEECVADG